MANFDVIWATNVPRIIDQQNTEFFRIAMPRFIWIQKPSSISPKQK